MKLIESPALKPASVILALCLLAGCAGEKPFKAGDVLVSAKDGTVLGTVIGLGDHAFENGASGASVEVQLPSGANAWYTLDTTRDTYVVRK